MNHTPCFIETFHSCSLGWRSLASRDSALVPLWSVLSLKDNTGSYLWFLKLYFHSAQLQLHTSGWWCLTLDDSKASSLWLQFIFNILPSFHRCGTLATVTPSCVPAPTSSWGSAIEGRRPRQRCALSSTSSQSQVILLHTRTASRPHLSWKSRSDLVLVKVFSQALNCWN